MRHRTSAPALAALLGLVAQAGAESHGDASQPPRPQRNAVQELRATLARSAEARANLKMLHLVEKAFYSEKDRYTDRVQMLGFEPEQKNRYSYYLAPAGVAARRTATAAPPPAEATIIGLDEVQYPAAHFIPTVKGTGCPVTLPPGMTEPGLAPPGKEGVPGFVLVAAGEIDTGKGLDCWSIASMDRQRAGEVIPAGEPLHERSSYDEVLAQRITQTLQALQVAALGVQDYRREKGALPRALAEVDALPHHASVAHRTDGWGAPLVYRLTERGSTVLSAGPDGREGTGDDLAMSVSSSGELTGE